MTQKQLAGLLEASALMGKPVFVEEINGAVSALYWEVPDANQIHARHP